jgi:hypothetical protein
MSSRCCHNLRIRRPIPNQRLADGSRFDGEYWALRQHEDALGIAPHEKLPHIRPPPQTYHEQLCGMLLDGSHEIVDRTIAYSENIDLPWHCAVVFAHGRLDPRSHAGKRGFVNSGTHDHQARATHSRLAHRHL